MSYQLVDEFRIVGLQNYNVDEKLNPIEITFRDSEIQVKLSRYGTQRYRYRFIVESLLVTAEIKQAIQKIKEEKNKTKKTRP